MGHLQQLRVRISNTALHPGVDHRQHMGKADYHRKVGTAHPQQSQDDKAGYWHGADKLHGRLNKNAHPAPAGTQRTQHQPTDDRQQEPGQYAQSTEHDALPETSCRHQLSQRLQCLYRCGEK